MPLARPPTGKRPVFWTLFLGLLAVFATALGLVVYSSPANPLEQVNEELVGVATLVSASVDVGAHAAFAAEADPDSPELHRINRVLTAATEGRGTVDRVFTLIRSETGQLIRALDVQRGQPTKPPSAPIDRVNTAMAKCVAFGLAVPSGVPVQRPDGAWIEAYAPLMDSTGIVSGVVVAAKRAGGAGSTAPNDLRWMYVPFVLAFLVSFAVAWTVEGSVSSRGGRLHPLLEARPTRVFIELAVILSVSAVLSQTIWRNAHLGDHRARRAVGISALRALTEANATLNAIQSRKPPDMDQVDATVAKLKKHRVGRVAEQIEFLTKLPDADPSRESLASTAYADVMRKQQEITEQLAVATVDEENRARDAFQTLIVTVAVAVAALALLRMVGQQQKALAVVTQDRNEARARYAKVVEELPIGLFVIENSQLAFTNEEWKRLFGGAAPGEEMTRFLAAVHPEDTENVVRVIREAEQHGKPFEVEYRIMAPGHRLMHLESRGTPVFDKDGICHQMLGFTLDVSQTVDAKQAIQRTFAEVENKNRLLSAALGELEMNLENVVRSLVRAVEAKDPYTAGHSERVKNYSLWLGERVGLSKFELRVLELGTLVHDVGKIGTPDAILTKPGRLTPEEYGLIKKHPEFGVNIIESIGLFRDCLPIVRWHHEKLNGTGYPDGLVGDEIPYLVRISTIADIFDAMTSTRAYRRGLGVDEVLATMTQMVEAGELDPGLFASFAQVITERGVINGGTHNRAA